MDQPTQSITSWLESLHTLIPPQRVVLVGAGNGRGAWVQWLLQKLHEVPLTFVEADGPAVAALGQLVARHASPAQGRAAREVLHATVAEQAGEVPFYNCSLALESGLLDPQALQSLWPNLQTLAIRQQQARALGTLLEQMDSATVTSAQEGPAAAARPAHDEQWLLLDCLPAARLLEAANAQLSWLNVVVARVLLESEENDVGALPSGTTLRELKQVLDAAQMRQVALQPSRHPAIGHALFVRDVCATLRAQAQQHAIRLQQLNASSDAQARAAAAALATLQAEQQSRASEAAQLRDERNAQIKAIADAQAALQAEQEARAQEETALAASRKEAAELGQHLHELNAQLQARTSESTQFQAERDAQTKAVAEVQAALEAQRQTWASEVVALEKECDAQARAAAAALAKLQAEEQSRASEAAQLRDERNAQIKAIADAQAALQAEQEARAQKETALAASRNEAAELGQYLQELKAQLQARTSEATQFQAERDAQTKAVAEAQAALEAQQETSASEVAALKKECDAQSKTAVDAEAALQAEQEARVSEAEQLKNERDAWAKAAAELQTALQAEQQARASAGAQLTLERDAFAKAVAKVPEPAASTSKFSGDADIDNFLEDIEPFFFGRSLTYVDAGAYVGEVFLKLLQSKKIPIREAHLFEPNPESYEKLKSNVASINIPKLHLYQYALGQDEGELHLSAAHSMSRIVKGLEQSATQTGVLQVTCRRLDDLLDLFTDQHIDLLKIDVEGFELDILEGAQRIFKEQLADVVYIEVGFRRDATQQTYFGLIDTFCQDLGYRVFKIYEQKNEWAQDSPFLRRCNAAYMSPRFASENPYKARQELVRLNKEVSALKAKA